MCIRDRIAHNPFDGPNERGDLVTYRANLAAVAPDVGWSDIGLQSWMAGRLFEVAFNALLSVEPENPTREDLIGVAQGINLFNANGVLSATNPGGRQPSPCFILMVVQNGRWEQVFPAAPRPPDCSDENLHELVTTRDLPFSSISANQSDDPSPVEEVVDPEPDLENPEPTDDE